MSKQDRQGARTPADLERRYNLGATTQSFAEAIGTSTDSRDYVDRISSELRSEFEQKVTSLTRDTERIVMAALSSYVETSDQEEFKQTIQSEMAVLAEKITMNFTSTEEQIDKINGCQHKKNCRGNSEIKHYFDPVASFSILQKILQPLHPAHPFLRSSS